MDPVYCLKMLLASHLEASALPMRSLHTPGPDAVIGDPHARGYLESVTACVCGIEGLIPDTVEELLTEAKVICENQKESMPSYVKISPEGQWRPGSPYDEGKVEGATAMSRKITEFMKKVGL